MNSQLVEVPKTAAKPQVASLSVSSAIKPAADDKKEKCQRQDEKKSAKPVGIAGKKVFGEKQKAVKFDAQTIVINNRLHQLRKRREEFRPVSSPLASSSSFIRRHLNLKIVDSKSSNEEAQNSQTEICQNRSLSYSKESSFAKRRERTRRRRRCRPHQSRFHGEMDCLISEKVYGFIVSQTKAISSDYANNY